VEAPEVEAAPWDLRSIAVGALSGLTVTWVTSLFLGIVGLTLLEAWGLIVFAPAGRGGLLVVAFGLVLALLALLAVGILGLFGLALDVPHGARRGLAVGLLSLSAGAGTALSPLVAAGAVTPAVLSAVASAVLGGVALLRPRGRGSWPSGVTLTP
jgi:hypothetical protein